MNLIFCFRYKLSALTSKNENTEQMLERTKEKLNSREKQFTTYVFEMMKHMLLFSLNFTSRNISTLSEDTSSIFT